jgi:hypothetical protein
MRRLVILIALAACGSSTSNPIDGHGGDGNKTDGPIDVGNFDFPCGAGAPCRLDQVCCAMPGATTTFSCVAPGSCPMADKITCDGPDECSGGQVCCGTYVPDGTGNPPQCGITSLGTACTASASCPTNLANSCSQTSTVTLCHHKAECTDSQNNQCCTFSSGAAALTFCIDGTTASLGGATCHN